MNNKCDGQTDKCSIKTRLEQWFQGLLSLRNKGNSRGTSLVTLLAQEQVRRKAVISKQLKERSNPKQIAPYNVAVSPSPEIVDFDPSARVGYFAGGPDFQISRFLNFLKNLSPIQLRPLLLSPKSS